MATSKSKIGREELVSKDQSRLKLKTKKEADYIINEVVAALESTLLSNLQTKDFTLKLSSFGKFTVRHKTGIVRFIPFTREVKQTKNKRKIRFTPLGELRRAEPEPESDPVNSKNDPKDSSK